MYQAVANRHADLIFLSGDNNPSMEPMDENAAHRAAMGRRITDLREAREWSQGQLGESAGIKQSSISDIEKGKTKEVAARTLIGISEALDTTIEYLWFGQGDAEEAELLSIYRRLDRGPRMALVQSARTLLTVRDQRPLGPETARHPLPARNRTVPVKKKPSPKTTRHA